LSKLKIKKKKCPKWVDLETGIILAVVVSIEGIDMICSL
jgi:hypothetical protein